MAGQDQEVLDRARQDKAGQGRGISERTGRGHEGLVRAGQSWARPGMTWHGQQNRTGSRRAALGSAEPGWVGHDRR